jgi:N4-gp56 family major capsid protein
MATTDFGAASALRVKEWSLTVTMQGRDDSFWFSNGFVSASTADQNKPIQRVTELSKTKRGLECVMPMAMDISADAAVVGDNLLDGNESAIDTDYQAIRVDQIRFATKSAGEMSEQSTVLNFRTQSKDKLAFALSDVTDELGFLTAAGRAYTLNTDGTTRGTSQLPSLTFAADVAAASTNRVIYAGSATSEATLTAADKMSWDLIIQAKAMAKRKRIRPIRMGGRSFYIMVMSTEQCRDLEQSPDYKTLQAQAMPRGLDNPLFTNAKKVVGDVVIHDHQKVFNTLGLSSGIRWGSGSTVHGAQAMLLGAQALGFAEITGDTGAGWRENPGSNDFGNRQSIGYGRKMGLLKPQYKSKYDSNTREDFGILSVKTAAAA